MKIERLPEAQTSACFISYARFGDDMNRILASFVVFLLSTQVLLVGTVSADLGSLTDAGQTDELDRPLVLWEALKRPAWISKSLWK